jgi:hypothetical protein
MPPTVNEYIYRAEGETFSRRSCGLLCPNGASINFDPPDVTRFLLVANTVNATWRYSLSRLAAQQSYMPYAAK